LIPSRAVLKRFGEIVRNLHGSITNNVQQNRTLTKIRDALLPKLLSGEIRVKEAENVLSPTPND
jgi:type I restriction enzyme S subunit